MVTNWMPKDPFSISIREWSAMPLVTGAIPRQSQLNDVS